MVTYNQCEDHFEKMVQFNLTAAVNVYDDKLKCYLEISWLSKVKFCVLEAILLVINESIRGCGYVI